MREGNDNSRSAQEWSDTLVVTEKSSSTLSLIAKALARILVLPLVSWRLIVYGLSCLIIGNERAFAAASESIARIPGMRGVYQRQAFYRRTLASCGKDVYFGWQTVFSKTGAKIGDGAYLGRRCSLGLVEIGEHTMLSDGVQILSGRRQHGTEQGGRIPYKDQSQTFSRVRIGSNAWIGTNAIIMADVGKATIIGAGAVVIEPIPDSSVAAGVPAEVKRRVG